MRPSNGTRIAAASLLLAGLASALACSDMAPREAGSAPTAAPMAKSEEAKQDQAVRSRGPGAPPPPAPVTVGLIGGMGRKEAEGDKSLMAALADAPMDGEMAKTPAEPEPAATRAWFPETFLFEPRVVTDERGDATVATKIPDRLTTWRVLALAHSRSGSQAGATAEFLGTLPAYVDPVVPPFLVAGDEVRLPIQVVNTSDEAVVRSLKLEVLGATAQGGSERLELPARGSRVEFATLKAARPGQVALRAVLGGSDAVERSIPVYPAGRPVEERRGGTLAAPRELTITGPANLDGDSAKVRLQVFPGALSLLRSELRSATGRGGVADDAYALLLAGKARELMASLGDVPDEQALRNLSIVAGQRVIRHGRSPGVGTASLLAEAALAHPQLPVLARLGERMADQIGRGQRPDGSCEGADGWTLNRLLASTAECVRAARAGAATPKAKQRAKGVELRASGFFERSAGRIEDGYTAAAVLSSGAIPGSLAEKLRAKVRGAVEQRPDGTRVLKLEPGAVRPDGTPPSEVEATALAVLALEGDPAAPWRSDLGAAVLARYHPVRGWGDGRTNLTALRAVLALFRDKLPAQVRVTLSMDGSVLAETSLDATRLKDVATLEAPVPGAAGPHRYELRAEPPVPGLGFVLALQTWVPWEKAGPPGLELSIERPPDARVGIPVEVAVAASSPAGMAVTIRHALPAGVQPEPASLAKLVSDGLVARTETEDGAVTLEVAPRAQGGTFQARYRVIPTLAGTLHAPASTVTIRDLATQVFHLPSAPWTVKP